MHEHKRTYQSREEPFKDSFQNKAYPVPSSTLEETLTPRISRKANINELRLPAHHWPKEQNQL